jgi:hypothetical protein
MKINIRLPEYMEIGRYVKRLFIKQILRAYPKTLATGKFINAQAR